MSLNEMVDKIKELSETDYQNFVHALYIYELNECYDPLIHTDEEFERKYEDFMDDSDATLINEIFFD